MKMVWRLLRMARAHRKTLIVAVLGLIGAAALNLITPEIVRKLTAALDGGAITTQMLGQLVLILVCAYFLRAVCLHGGSWLTLHSSCMTSCRDCPCATIRTSRPVS